MPAMVRSLSPAWLASYHRASRDPATSALAILPLVVLYGVGLAHASPRARSGVDPVSEQLLAILPPEGYLGLQVGLAFALLIFAAARARGAFRSRLALTAPVVGESTLYGLTLGLAVLWILDTALALSTGGGGGDLLDRAVTAAGAGLHEELVFRLLLLTGLVLLVRRVLSWPSKIAVVLAVLLSSLAFAAAHHIAGEPFAAFPFAYRSVAGALFACLYLLRGFGVVVWTHAIYDFYVLGLG